MVCHRLREDASYIPSAGNEREGGTYTTSVDTVSVEC